MAGSRILSSGNYLHRQCTDWIFLCLECLEAREEKFLLAAGCSDFAVARWMQSALLIGRVTGSRESHMPDLPDELIRTNAILNEYAAIHDAIFKFSWRKTLPIPGLFKATDFGAHFKDLDRLASKLARISSALKVASGSLEGSPQYTEALLETIQALREICGRFYKQSQGEIGKYPMAEYNADLKSYEVLVNKCQELGVALNQRLRDNDTLPES